jgi:hypothetical protein
MQTRSKFETRRAVVAFLLLASTAALVAGCKTLAGARHTGVIIARRAQIRSSTAIVAADIKEVLRGEVVDIVETKDTKGTEGNSGSEVVEQGGERWLRVRTHDAEGTEGWIEARNVMPQELLERSLRLSEEDKDIPAQSTGQLRASANLRFSPDRSNNENILLKMEGGSHFDIVGWKRVPKPKAAETTESDDAPKAGSAQTNNRKRGESEAAKAPEETNELWYKVRLTPDISPAPAGWVFGKQVELSVPSDIVFYRAGREFVAWHRLDEVDKGNSSAAGGAGEVKESLPGSWVILERSDSDEPSSLDDPDFDRIYVLGYDKTRQEHYTAYRSHDLRGHLPLRIEGSGDGKSFVVRLEDGKEVKDYRFRVYKDDHGHLRAEPQQELPGSPKKK